MNEPGSNGSTNGKATPSAGMDPQVGKTPEDPFASGVWVLAMIGERDVLARIVSEPGGRIWTEEDAPDDPAHPGQRMPPLSEDALRQEMAEFRSICVVLRPRYVLSQIGFPLPVVNELTGQRTGELRPGFIPATGKHETCLELEHDFPVFANLTVFAFLSDFHPDDVERLRKSVYNADESAEQSARFLRSNLVSPSDARVVR